MTPRQLLRILQARYRLALGIFLLTVALGVGVSLLMDKQYTAAAALVLDVKSPDALSGQMLQGMVGPGYMATQTDIIGSERVARAAVQLLHLDENTLARTQWQNATQGRGQLIDWLAARLSQKLEVRPARESSVINISYTASDPDFAAAVANAFARAYMNVNLDLRLAPARRYASFFDGQTGDARARLEHAQAVLSDYRQSHGITSSDEKMDFETARLNETSSQLTALQGQTTDSQSKRENARADTVAEVMQSPLTNGMKADIVRLEAKLADNNGNLGKNHPQTLRAELELASLRAQLAAETQRITRSIETTYEVGRQRERSLQGSLASQKSRVLVLNKQRDELNVMQGDVESARRAFETLSQRASQATIESRTDQTNISLLNPAVAPPGPSRPRMLLNGLLSALLGALLGCTVALVTELTHRRIRSVQDLQEVLNIPSLGAVAMALTLPTPSGTPT